MHPSKRDCQVLDLPLRLLLLPLLVAALPQTKRMQLTAGVTERLHLGELAVQESTEESLRTSGNNIPSRVQDRVAVAAGEIVLLYNHVFDVTFYLAQNSSLWGRKVSSRELVDGAVGSSTLRFDVKSKLVTHSRLSDYWRGELKHRFHDRKAVQQWARKLDHGPYKGVGSVIQFTLDKDGVQLIMEGEDQGKVESDSLSRAILDTYFDGRATNQEFRQVVLQRVQSGLPDADDSSVTFVRYTGFQITPTLVAIVIALLLLGLVAACMLVYKGIGCCIRQLKKSGEPAEVS
eukprot:TRINITY_DN3666_c0_g1_i1.p1 TRINITY_DN3666_c0_g1~~TRINITY_DN3666_c0_g1_i1.p1  ORF type:complete len:290 (-),score=46.91 TRINITY_DN3666_c0_g1_i1:36-905(-)